MAQERIAEQVAGVVTCSNPKGFQLAGREGWLNVSKFAAGVEVPAKGQRVEVGLDKAGFVREVVVIAPEPSANPPAANILPGNPDRETRITRSACLNTAVSILSASGAVEVGDVLAVAELLEHWVTR